MKTKEEILHAIEVCRVAVDQAIKQHQLSLAEAMSSIAVALEWTVNVSDNFQTEFLDPQEEIRQVLRRALTSSSN